MIFFYVLIEILVFPFFLIYSFLNKKIRSTFFYRASFFLPENENTILFHAVSVGEFIAAKRLIKILSEKYGNIIVSTITKTAREVVLMQGLKHCFFPFDFPFMVEKFLKKLKPKLIVILETEIWPYFIFTSKRKKIPVILINGRISKKSFKRYKFFSFFFKEFFKKIDLILAQTEEDAKRFKEIGAKNVEVYGNLKFDFEIKEIEEKLKDFYEGFINGREGIVAGSTVRGEEEIILSKFKELLEEKKGIFLILAPRHPERAKEVEEIIRKNNLNFIKRTDFPVLKDADVLLVDVVGELSFLYRYGKIAFVGGSLVDKGGHNILEPAFFKVPIVIGPYYDNFKEIVEQFIKKEAIIILSLENFSFKKIFFKDLKEMGERGYQIIKENEGIVEKTLKRLEEFLNL